MRLQSLKQRYLLTGIFTSSCILIIFCIISKQECLQSYTASLYARGQKTALSITINGTLPADKLSGNISSPERTVAEFARPMCPEKPPGLLGHRKVIITQTAVDAPRMRTNNVSPGGRGKPPACTARQRVAIIVPFRNREIHLPYFLEYMHPIFQRQQLDYQIFVISQVQGGVFNKNKLMNVGFVEAQKVFAAGCFVFHDVDIILEDDRNLYWCSQDNPVHLAVGVEKNKYHLPYDSYYGGALMLTKRQMEAINGFSNNFRGWGGEDDDNGQRIHLEGYRIARPWEHIAKYKSLTHERDKGNERNLANVELLKETNKLYKTDGLNNLTYEVVNIEFEPLFTNITVDIGEKYTHVVTEKRPSTVHHPRESVDPKIVQGLIQKLMKTSSIRGKPLFPCGCE